LTRDEAAIAMSLVLIPILAISLVGAALFWIVHKLEGNNWLGILLKIWVVLVSIAAIVVQLLP
jgi:hypothetical protein